MRKQVGVHEALTDWKGIRRQVEHGGCLLRLECRKRWDKMSGSV